VYAADLDGDGDQDVLSASWYAAKIAWHENLGGGSIGPEQIISTDAVNATSVYAQDLDGDGDVDVLSSSASDDKAAWYENVGKGNGVNGGSFGPQRIVNSPGSDWAWTIHSTDLTGDGAPDIVLGSMLSSDVSWFQNLGGGTFGTKQLVATGNQPARSVCGSDLDGDGDTDLLVGHVPGSGGYGSVVWYENVGQGNGVNGGTFGPDQHLATVASPRSVYAADLDGDGDADALSVEWGNGTVIWFENVGNGNGVGGGAFGPMQRITSSAAGASSVYASDLDGDGDFDVLSASRDDDKIAWYENVGLGNGVNGGTFGPQRIITTTTDWALSVHATDLNGDGYADVLSASKDDDKIAWYESLLGADCNGNGIPDKQDIADGTSADCNGNGIPDECDIADDPSLDCDLDGVLDSCQLLSNPSLDCDGDGILDTCQIAGDPSLDQDGDGVLDSCQCAFANFCLSTGNSTGLSATIGWSGSASISANDLTLTASDLPPFQFGIFFYGADEWLNIMGDGVLCISPPLYRIKTVVTTGASGTAALAVDYNTQPFASGAGQVLTFSTWRFQLWYRDPTGGPAGSNTTDGLMITFCP